MKIRTNCFLAKAAALALCVLTALGAVSCAGSEESSSNTPVSESLTETSAAVTDPAETSGVTTVGTEPAASAESAKPEPQLPDSPLPDYSFSGNWAFYAEGENKTADLFIIAPTVNSVDSYNSEFGDNEVRSNIYFSVRSSKGIYDTDARVFSPFYEQCSMKVYNELAPEEREPYLRFAYRDVSEAFRYYLEHENKGRPIILAGFSQGADMCYRLLKEYFGDEELYSRLVACYAIGWACTEEMTKQYPQIRMAEGQYDTGCVISYECEAELVDDSLVCPKGTKMLSINPLNWKRDPTPADKSLNKGACFYDSYGGISSEMPGLCGCYVDPERGTLKVTDIAVEDYPTYLAGQMQGVYHTYDLVFFYRNLQENVKDRLEAYLTAAEKAA